jgi:antitoxin YefM
MTAVTISQAREQLFPLVRQVNEDHSTVEIVSRNGNAVLMSADDYSSMQETLYLLSTPANAARLSRSIDQLRAGDVVEVDLDDIRAQINDMQIDDVE